MNKYSLLMISLIFIGCNYGKESHDKNVISIKEKQAEYLKEKGWLAPADMQIIEKAMPQSTEGMNPNERKETIISGLEKMNISKTEIARIMEELKNERTIYHEWDYNYIRARMRNYKNEMDNDSVWLMLMHK